MCPFLHSYYWVGQKLHSSFSIRWCGKTQNFWPTQYFSIKSITKKRGILVLLDPSWVLLEWAKIRNIAFYNCSSVYPISGGHMKCALEPYCSRMKWFSVYFFGDLSEKVHSMVQLETGNFHCSWLPPNALVCHLWAFISPAVPWWSATGEEGKSQEQGVISRIYTVKLSHVHSVGVEGTWLVLDGNCQNICSDSVSDLSSFSSFNNRSWFSHFPEKHHSPWIATENNYISLTWLLVQCHCSYTHFFVFTELLLCIFMHVGRIHLPLY